MNRIILRDCKPMEPRAHFAGFTLVELLVGVAIGVFLLFGVVAVFTNTVRGSADNLRSARLNQELSSVMEMMVNDIRRAGYTNDVRSIYSNTTTEQRTVSDITLPSATCILYSYNENNDADLDNEERHGFKRAESGGIGRIEFGTNVNDCNGDWPDLTDPSVVDVTSVEFSTTGSKCLNRGTLDIDDAPGPIAYWVTTNAQDNSGDGFPSGLLFPCDEATGSTNVGCPQANGTFQTGDCPYVGGAFSTTAVSHVAPRPWNNGPPAIPGHRTAETRQVNILLRGRPVGDNLVLKELKASVKLRNDFARTH
jgi:type II secretory pathway pseudopilin PulG